jgi:hypothetical protein
MADVLRSIGLELRRSLLGRQVGGWPEVVSLTLAALMLCLVALWNGQPFFYPDTPTYVRGAEMGVTRVMGEGRLPSWLPAQPASVDEAQSAGAPTSQAITGQVPRAPSLTSVADKVVLAGRSVYYGALLYASYILGSLWLAVLAQALAVAYVLHLLVVRLWGLGRGTFLGIVAVLAAVTPLAVFTGFLMPDVFAGLAILSVATLCVYWNRLARSTRWALAGILLFGLSAHASHVAIAALLVLLILVARLTRTGRALAVPAIAVVASCILGAVAAEAAFGLAVKKAIGAPPLRMPHPVARLVDMGPGTDFLRRNCPQVGYAACDFVRNYPTAWDDFLFSTDPAKGAFGLADAATKRRMADEQLGLALAIFRHDPAGVLGGIAVDVVRQIGLFQVDVAEVSVYGLSFLTGRVPNAEFERLQAVAARGPSILNEVLTALTYASTAASLLLGAVWGWRRTRDRTGRAPRQDASALECFACIVVAGVLGNAVVCATLASSLDRFQSRVVWLLPFLALSMLALACAPKGYAPGAVRPLSNP